ncbi:CfrBI family restriction endonuclease, partial [Cronobacter sakazakii]|nr:CfrBI family restriction endonuclease [Cronobacter sakazakii]
WLVMMTNKQTQNVLRDAHDDGFGRLTERTQEQVIETIKQYSDTIKDIKINDIEIPLEDFCYMLLSLGSQTLTIRGSEKSLHGKYFEKLILGSLFTILGFEYVENLDENIDRKCFTLSLRSDDRESDATVLFNRKIIRVDIGFIGRGNTEISLDKVSRFRWMDAIGGIRHHVSTMVIVDVIGDGSRISNIAEEIDGKIEAMSNPYWVKNVATHISDKLSVENVFNGCETLKDIQNEISQRLNLVDLEKYIQM